MRAMVMRALGEPSALELCELPDPVPQAGQVAIDVEASGCNFADVLLCRGRYQLRPELPFSPGAEVAGRVRALGSGVTSVSLGQRVIAQLGYGGFASVVVADARRVQVLADDVSFEEGAALGIAHLTAYLSLVDRAALAPGEHVLVTAAAGGVGLAALQIARALGGHVIAAVGSDDKLAVCLEQGAHAAISSAQAGWEERVKELTEGHGADIVIESVGGDVLDKSLKHLAWGARVIIVGFSSGDIPAVKLNRVMLKHVSLVGLNLGGYHAHAPEALRSAVTRLFELRGQGVRAVVHATYPLERAGEALTALAERRTTGKVVLLP